MTDPINQVQWMDASDLQANDYNPNAVFSPELKLLERSILRTGWVHPILVSREKIIIDGFHRWMLSRDSSAIRSKYQGKVPCIVLDVGRAEAMILTVRMNRAKGSHIAVRMNLMVKELVDTHAITMDDIAQEIGATMQEVRLLYQDGVFTAKDIANYKYSKAWIPAETRHDDKKSRA